MSARIDTGIWPTYRTVIRALRLPRDLAGALDPSVRDQYLELWRAIQDLSEE